ncbi:MAG: cytochrome-c oxidase, cbb3-type subunit III [Hyphomonadaceae bacterium]
MTDHSPDTDEVTGVQTTGHEWDGIKELTHPLPRWWLWIFYASIVFSIGYWILMPAWPAFPGMDGYTRGVLGESDRGRVEQETKDMMAERTALSAQLASMDMDAILKNPQQLALAMALGESKFGDNCATCHAPAGGRKGYPTLADDVWLWGGTLEQIEYTIKHGARSGAEGAHTNDMPAFGRDGFLDSSQIADLVEYVMSVSGHEADRAAVARAAPIFEKECSSCHGVDAKGGETEGAPNLTDGDWLHGDTRADVRNMIWYAKAGVMPAWEARLDPASIRALAIYVHSLGGGE